ncbi:uncharacterized protein LOC116853856 [Odontomachus brunneus]|uniref:uncharacterized protein LOC116853856 n=1 Tax=Odontomachus brunneus TaxID=486640 RepID=UPI0013F183E5|nr:uncharacterized protein LOC116853856 [Odontomachus brunneus]
MKTLTPRMHVLKLTCTIVMIAGCLRPQSWTSLPKRVAYNIYRLYVISMLYTFSMTQFLDMVLVIDNAEDFTDNLNMMITVTAACYKMFLMWISYEDVAALINKLNEEPFKPLDRSEMEIRQKFDHIIR